MFWNKKINSDEYEKLNRQIGEIDSKVKKLEADLLFYSDKVLKKIRKSIPKYEEESEDNSPDLEEIRRSFGGDLPIELQGKNIRSNDI